MGRSARRKGRAGPPLCMPFMHNGHCPSGPRCPYQHLSFNGARPALQQQQLQLVKQVQCKTWPALQGSTPSHCRSDVNRTVLNGTGIEVKAVLEVLLYPMQADKEVGSVTKVPDDHLSEGPSVHEQAQARRSSFACQCALLTNKCFCD